jgi:hypothetical protein
LYVFEIMFCAFFLGDNFGNKSKLDVRRIFHRLLPTGSVVRAARVQRQNSRRIFARTGGFHDPLHQQHVQGGITHIEVLGHMLGVISPTMPII